MGASPRRGVCRQCNEVLDLADGPGRKKEYCDAACRRQAQRQRDGVGGQRARSALPLGRRIAEDLQVLSAGLLDAEHDGQPVEELLRCAAELAQEVEYYRAAAVQDARSQGVDWARVAAAAGVSAATARNRWAESEVQRRMKRRASQRSGARPVPAAREGEAGRVLSPAAERAGKKLAAALLYLHRSSGLSIREVADRTSLSASYISRILSGERTPGWPVVRDLALLCEGDPAELSVLWESAHGMTTPARPAIGDAVARLRAALRGLYLAADRPEVAQLRRASRGVLTVQSITDMLEGEMVPGWEATSALVAAMGGWPADIRPLWEAVHYAFLVCLDPVPLPQPQSASTDPGGTPQAPPELP